MNPSPPPAIVSPSPARRTAPWIAAPRPWNAAVWQAQHERYAAQARAGGIDAIFLGDSIVEYFAVRAPEVWMPFVQRYGNVANFGISGDRTQFVLWRVQHGELDGSDARAVVIEIGTNNLAVTTPAQVVRGIVAVGDAVRARVPNAAVLVCGLFPRGDGVDPLRAKAAEVNALLAPAAAERGWTYVAPPSGFVDQSGALDRTLLPDGLHPSAAGYVRWATALRPSLDALFGT